MNKRRELENNLFCHAAVSNNCSNDIYGYAGHIAQFENCIVAVSDLRYHKTRIFLSDFAKELGLTDYRDESSIWENRIIAMLSGEEQEEKYIGELRFFNFVRLLPRKKRSQYFFAAKLHLKGVEVLHRMHYIYDEQGEGIRYALCRYERQWQDFPGKCVAVNSMTGRVEELTSETDKNILSRRERQVLTYIDAGKTSVEIAEGLMISKNTVSRHRQAILSKLQVRNSLEACKVAKALSLI
ncbi:MAG: helix-turn-helix transcriptional regulator [Muribaculaceae bacterium]|nr:helix-turn-helix transcriptional regulator [Muribaculaceae bacterium]